MSKASTETETTAARVMGVNQFLEIHPQKEGIGGLVRTLYAKKTMTEEEWLLTVKTLLERKVK